MEHSKRLSELMSTELPNLTYQKKRLYRTNLEEVYELFDIINQEVFDGELPKPKIIVKTHIQKKWGECQGYLNRTKKNKSLCVILLNKNWYCKQWLITVLAHEMVHQHQWDIQSEARVREGKDRLMSHGPSFYKFKNKLKSYGIPLKHRLSIINWFKTQNILKC